MTTHDCVAGRLGFILPFHNHSKEIHEVRAFKAIGGHCTIRCRGLQVPLEDAVHVSTLDTPIKADAIFS